MVIHNQGDFSDFSLKQIRLFTCYKVVYTDLSVLRADTRPTTGGHMGYFVIKGMDDMRHFTLEKVTAFHHR